METIKVETTEPCKCCDAVMWNPWNKVTQCHNCGRRINLVVSKDFLPYWTTALSRAKSGATLKHRIGEMFQALGLNIEPEQD